MMKLKWSLLVKKCFQQRISFPKFQSYVELLQKDSNFDGTELSLLILDQIGPKSDGIDPLVTMYLEGLLSKRLITPHDALRALLDYRRSTRAAEDHDAFTNTSIRLTIESLLDHSILMHLARSFAADSLRREAFEYGKLFDVLAAWMGDLVAQAEDMMVSTAAASSQELMQAVMISRESFATMLITCLANAHVVEHLKGDQMRGETSLQHMRNLSCPHRPRQGLTADG